MRLTKHCPQAAYKLLLPLAETRPVGFDRRVQSGGKLTSKRGALKGTQSCYKTWFAKITIILIKPFEYVIHYFTEWTEPIMSQFQEHF